MESLNRSLITFATIAHSSCPASVCWNGFNTLKKEKRPPINWEADFWKTSLDWVVLSAII